MSKVTVHIPEPVEAEVTIVLTLDEARALRDVFGMTGGSGFEDLYNDLVNMVKGAPNKFKVYRRSNGGISIEDL